MDFNSKIDTAISLVRAEQRQSAIVAESTIEDALEYITNATGRLDSYYMAIARISGEVT